MNKKGLSMLLIVAIIAIVLVVGVVAVYFVFFSGEQAETVSDATSLKIVADVVGGDQGTFVFEWAAKNIGTNNLKFRLTINGQDSIQFNYIVDKGQQKAWSDETGAWLQTDFTETWNLWGVAWNENMEALKTNWTGSGTYSFTNFIGDHITFTQVDINPTLADSLFEPNM